METSKGDVFNHMISNLTRTNLMSFALNGGQTSNYNLDASIVNSNINSILNSSVNTNVNSSLFNGSFVNSSTNVDSGLFFPSNSDCLDPIKNASCFINSQLGNDSQLLNEFAMPFILQLIWSFIFGLIVFISTAGNCIVCWIILFQKRMRSVTNFHLFNLSVADIMVSTLNVVFNFIYMLNTDWKFGKIYCKISNFIAILSVSASVWSLFAISVDRYLAIIYPLKKRISKVCTINITISIWFFSAFLSLPNIIYSTTEKETFKNGQSKVICYLVWPDGISSKSVSEYIYNIIIIITTYCIPISGMIAAYFRIGIVLWSSKCIGEYCTDKQLESIKSKRKIVKMMIFIVSIFAVLWLPYHVYFILAHHFPEISNYKHVQHIYLAIYALAMSHSMSNPLILCWMNSRFRSGFRSVFCCVCLRSKSSRQRFKQKNKKRSQYSEIQANQARVRCTTISTGHTVQPIMRHQRIVRENHISLVNTTKNEMSQSSPKRITSRQHLSSKHCQSANQPGMNESNGPLDKNEVRNSEKNLDKLTGDMEMNNELGEPNNNKEYNEDHNEKSHTAEFDNKKQNKVFCHILHETEIEPEMLSVEDRRKSDEFQIEVQIDK